MDLIQFTITPWLTILPKPVLITSISLAFCAAHFQVPTLFSAFKATLPNSAARFCGRIFHGCNAVQITPGLPCGWIHMMSSAENLQLWACGLHGAAAYECRQTLLIKTPTKRATGETSLIPIFVLCARHYSERYAELNYVYSRSQRHYMTTSFGMSIRWLKSRVGIWIDLRI